MERGSRRLYRTLSSLKMSIGFLILHVYTEHPDLRVYVGSTSGAKVIKLFSCSAQLRLKFILLINVKMPTIVGILTFISRINYRLWKSEPSISISLGYFSIYEDLKF